MPNEHIYTNKCVRLCFCRFYSTHLGSSFPLFEIECVTFLRGDEDKNYEPKWKWANVFKIYSYFKSHKKLCVYAVRLPSRKMSLLKFKHDGCQNVFWLSAILFLCVVLR